MRLATTFLALLLVPRLAGAQQPTHGSYVPPQGFVPDSITAVRISVAVWTPIYGPYDALVFYDQPVARLNDGVWTVTRRVARPNPGPILMIRGSNVLDAPLPVDTAVVKMAKRDGRILYQGRT